MSNALIDESLLVDIADSIRSKNGSSDTYTPSEMATAIANINTGGGGSVSLQAKTATPTESAQIIKADSGYDGLSSVAVGAISSTYVGSEVARKSSSDLTVSGATVTVPVGYYANQATKSVASGSATPASSISGTAATVSTGTNTLTLTKTVSNTPQVSVGYVSAGTAGNSSVSLTANVTTKAAVTYYPSTTDQTISASQYLTGVQTIKAVTVSGLSASNIASGVTVNIGDSADADRIMSVTGTLTFSNITVSSSDPSGGSNGDVWVKTS